MDIVVLANHENIRISEAADPAKLFLSRVRSEKNFGGSDGYYVGESFSTDEILLIKKMIKDHIVSRGSSISKELGAQLINTELEDYHTVVGDVYHSSMFTKLGRILSDSSVQEIKKFSVFRYLKNCFGEFELSDEEGLGFEQISFRIVRPNVRSDIGDPHRDAWFWDVLKTPNKGNKNRVKVWFMVGGEPENAGLLLAQGSHLMDIPYQLKVENGRNRFVSELPKNISFKRFAGDLGQTIMFNYQCLHAGAVNYGDKCRISCEMTILF